MKKYVKPELFYEGFELSQQIAACDYDSEHTSADESCTFTSDIDGTIIFMSGCGGSTPDNKPIFRVETYCYHNSNISPYGIFNS